MNNRYLLSILLALALLPVQAMGAAPHQAIAQNLVKNAPADYFPASAHKALSLLKEGKDKKAIKEAVKARGIASTAEPLDRIFILEGLGYQNMGDDSAALRAYRKAMKIRASNSDTLYLVGLTQGRLGQVEPALETLKEALFYNRFGLVNEQAVKQTMSSLYAKGEDFTKARELGTQALGAGTETIDERIQLSEIQLKDGKKAEAIKVMKAAVAKEPEHIDAKLQYAKVLLHNIRRDFEPNHVKEADSITEELSGLDSLTEEQALSLARLRLKALIEAQKLDQARELFQDAAQRYPHDPVITQHGSQLHIEQQAQEFEAQKEEARAHKELQRESR